MNRVHAALLCLGLMPATAPVWLGRTAFAQGTRASLTGTVTDPAGAAVVGATVSATRLETNETQEKTTDAQGGYLFPVLEVGSYRITAQAPGFMTYVREGVVLQVEQRARLDIGLAVGALEQRIQVVGEAPLTETQSSSLGQVIDSKRILDLPLNGRNPLELMRLAPGVNLLATAFLDVRNFNLASVIINGGQGGTNAVLLDGGSVTLPGRNEYSVAPNVDAIQEFRVQTNAFSAEFGLTGGGAITMITKSGTNEFHGALFEFLRNDKLDANGWTNNSRNLKKAALRYNQFGGTIGGPVQIPRIYSGTDKTFFLFNFEGIRFRSNLTSLASVPTSLEREGDFRQTFIRDPRSAAYIPVQLHDPFTTRANPAGPGFVRDPFPTSVVPRAMFDPVAIKALAYIPAANRPPADPTGTNNFASTPSIVTDNDQFNIRLDHQIGPRHKLFGRYTHNDALNTGTPPLFGLDNIADPGGSTQERYNKNLTVSLTSTFTPTLLNELRASVTRQYLLSSPPGYGKNAPAAIGIPGTPADVFPRFEVSDSVSIGNRADQIALRGQTIPLIADTLTKIAGRHQLKVGVDLRSLRYNNYQPSYVSGNYSFTRGLTGNPQQPTGTGYGVATFLLGTVDTGSLNVGVARADVRDYYAFFVQDDWKITRRLTLNLGLRYDIITSPVERYDRYSTFNPSASNSLTRSQGAVHFAGVNFGRRVFDTDLNNFGPRVGFAYDVQGDARTVIRGAYGAFHYHGGVMEYPGTDGFSTATPYQSPLGPFPAFLLKNGPPNILQPLGKAGGDATFLGANVSLTEPTSRTSYAHQWNFGIQRLLPANILVDIAYAGNRTVKAFTGGWDLNQMDPRYLALGLALDDRVSNPFFDVIPTGPLSGSTIARSQALRPYPAYLNINVSNPRLGSSIYTGMELKVEKRFAAGLTFLNSYTMGKTIGDIGRNLIDFTTTGGAPQFSVGCGQNTRFDRASCRSIEPQDLFHNFVGSYVYELPFGRGRKWLSKPGVGSFLLGGWQLNTILTLRGGLPLVIRGAQNRAADRPNVVRKPTLTGGERSLRRWFDTGAFAAPPLFTYGNVPRTQPELRGPGFAAVDLSVFKEFPFSERWRLQFRSELFNAFNRVNFDQPNVSFLAGAFGTITSAGEPRRIQFGLKLVF